MTEIIDDKDYLNLADTASGHPFHFLWSDICSLVEKPKHAHLSSFADRRDIFLWVLKRMLDEKKVFIGKKGEILNKSTADIIEAFKSCFPKDDNEMENGIWFLNYNDEPLNPIWHRSPGGAVWLTDDDCKGYDTIPAGNGKFYYWT